MSNRPNLQAVDSIPARDERPKLFATAGRGGTGKSTMARIIAERAHEAGQEIVVADADRNNATLPSFLDGVLRPEYGDERSLQLWFESVISEQAKAKATVILDVGGGDRTFRTFAAEVELANLLEAEGILPVGIHMVGPDPDDLAHLADAFTPKASVVVLNEGCIRDGRPADAAFKPIRHHRLFRMAIEQGAREIVLPRLGCMAEVNERRLSFRKAQSDPDIGLINRQRVLIWRKAVEKALLPIAEWLP